MFGRAPPRVGQVQQQDATIGRVAFPSNPPPPLQVLDQATHGALLQPEPRGQRGLGQGFHLGQLHQGMGRRDTHRLAAGRAVGLVQAEGAYQPNHLFLELLRVHRVRHLRASSSRCMLQPISCILQLPGGEHQDQAA